MPFALPSSSQPIWFDDDVGIERSLGSGDQALPKGVDVAVVGGGLAGVCLTYWLARRGLRVALLEAERLGRGASGRNAGLMLHGMKALERASLTASVLRDERLSVGYRRTGHLSLVMTEPIWARTVQEAASSSHIHAIDRAECEQLLGQSVAPSVLGGRWYPAGASLHPVRLLQGLAEGALRHGADIHEMTSCVGIRSSSTGLRSIVLTERGQIEAEHVAVACQIGTSRLFPNLTELFRPASARMIATEPIEPTFAFGMAVDWGTLYWRQLDSGALVLGGNLPHEHPLGTGTPGDLSPLQALGVLFPGFRPPAAARSWDGMMDYTIDGLPIVGPVSPDSGEWVFCGFGGHGLPPMMGFARAIAEGIATGRVPQSIACYSPSRCGLQSTAEERMS